MSALPPSVHLPDIASLVASAMDELRVPCAVETKAGEERIFSFVGQPSAGDLKVTVSIDQITPDPVKPLPPGVRCRCINLRQVGDQFYCCKENPMINSASDDRTANNAVRHQYRVLSDTEKAQMVAIKDKGAEFLTLIDSIRTPPQPVGEGENDLALCTFDRELNIAAERVEEAVMWAVKHVTR